MPLISIGRRCATASPGRPWAAFFAVLVLAGLVAAAQTSAPLVADPDELAKPGSDLFTNGPVPLIQIEVSKAAYQSLQQSPRTPVSATVKEGGKTYLGVAVHIKGAAGSFRDVNNKPGMMLHFGRMTPDQRFHGLKKLMLNNSVQDPTYLNEKICGYLFRLAGVPSPRTGHAIVELNGRKLGLYITKEDFHEDFLKRYFGNATGNLYDIKPGRDLNEEMTLDFGEGPKDRADLNAAAAACQEPDAAKRWERLQATVDVERFASFMAVESLTAHWDGYCRARNNFRIYAEAGSGRLVFIPSDLDQMFREPGRFVFDPGEGGMVARAFMQTPAARQLFYDRAAFIATNIYRFQDLSNRVNQTAFRIREALVKHDPGARQDFDNHHRQTLQALAVREETGRKQVAEFARRKAKFENGVFKPLSWGPIYEGGADLQKKKDPAALYIRAGHGGAPSWRSRTVVGPGKYRFEGRVKTTAVAALKNDLGEGAGLRVNGKPARQNKLGGTADWQKLEYEFDVAVDGEEIEMVCELRAKGGEAWFDTDSMKLMKIK